MPRGLPAHGDGRGTGDHSRRRRTRHRHPAIVGFLSAAAPKTRASMPTTFWSEVETATKLSFTDRLLYRYILIPRTREALFDPAAVLFDPAIREHSRDPQSEIPFSQPPMKDLRSE